MINPSFKEQDHVQQAEQAFSRLSPAKPISPKLLRKLWKKQIGPHRRKTESFFEAYLRPAWVSLALFICVTAGYFIYQSNETRNTPIVAGFIPQEPMGSPTQPFKTEPFRMTHLRKSGALCYTINYQKEDSAIDTAIYLLRQGRLERGAENLLPLKKENGKLTFQAEVRSLIDETKAGALQMGWQKLIIVLAPKGAQPRASEVLEQVNAPLLRKARQWTYLEHEVNIVN